MSLNLNLNLDSVVSVEVLGQRLHGHIGRRHIGHRTRAARDERLIPLSALEPVALEHVRADIVHAQPAQARNVPVQSKDRFRKRVGIHTFRGGREGGGGGGWIDGVIAAADYGEAVVPVHPDFAPLAIPHALARPVVCGYQTRELCGATSELGLQLRLDEILVLVRISDVGWLFGV